MVGLLELGEAARVQLRVQALASLRTVEPVRDIFEQGQRSVVLATFAFPAVLQTPLVAAVPFFGSRSLGRVG